MLRIDTSDASVVFDHVIKLLPKPLTQAQEFLAFPQNLPDIKPLGELCLLGEDELCPHTEYMVHFEQNGVGLSFYFSF